MDIYEIMSNFEDYLLNKFADKEISFSALLDEKVAYSYDDKNFQYVTINNLEKFLEKHGWNIRHN